MTHPVELERQLDLARRENERWIDTFAMLLAGAFCLLAVLRMFGRDPASGAAMLAISAGALLYYAHSWLRARSKAPPTWEVGLRTAVEVSLPTLLLWVQAARDPTQALLNTAVVLYQIGIFLGILRLRPLLPLLGGAVAASGWIASYYALVTPEALSLAPLTHAAAWERVVLLLFCGALAWHVARSLERLTGKVSEATLDRERVRRAFGAYVAEPVVERVLRGDLKLSTERRVVTVLFVDIRGFTAFSEAHPPDAVLDQLNQALEAFSVEVRDRGGIVNKYLGDGLMALFGAPAEEPHHARQAAEAALAIARRAEELERSGVYPGLRIGVGVHSGEVVVGDIGGRGHREYTAIGDVVNVAARVESATKEVGSPVLITEAVREAMGAGFRCGEPVARALKGRDQAVQVIPLLSGPR